MAEIDAKKKELAGIDAKKINLRDIFSPPYQFTIPNFQRPLSWKTDDFDKLFEDIYGAFQNEQEEYFLGSIILQKKGRDVYDIIDGQQRLTAIAILLATVRDITTDNELRTSAQGSLFQKEDRFKNLPAVARIKMWEDLHDLESYIYGEGKIHAYKNAVEQGIVKYKDKEDPIYLLSQAIDLYLQKCENIDRLGKLEDFVTYLFNNVYVVFISTESLSYAIQLFIVLNTRGLPLTPADILKAGNLAEIEPEKRDEWAKKWREIEDNLGRKAFEEVIGFIRTLKLKTKAKASIYDEYKNHIYPKLLKKGEDFITYLEEISDIFQNIVEDPDNLRVDAKYKNLVRLMREYIPFSDWIPPLIAFYEKFCFPEGRNMDKLGLFLQSLEKKTVMEWIAGYTSTERIESLNGVIKLIEREEDPGNIIVGIQEKKLRELEPKFKDGIDSRYFYFENFAKYLLLRLDLEQWDQENFAGYQGTITIEHILPQEPAEDSEWYRKFEEQFREEWTNKLGNLILLGRRKNSRARNFDFKKKKDTYFFKEGTSPFKITQELQNFDEWTPETLENRHKDLIERLVKIYF